MHAKTLALVSLLAFCGAARADDCPTQPSGFAGGDGSAGDPYLVCSAAQLQLVGSHLGAGLYFRQIADIDLAGVAFTPIGAQTFGGPPLFNGVYDGAGYEIFNLEIIQPGTDVLGLFGKISTSAEVRNVTLRNVNISGNRCVCGLAAENQGLIVGCSVTGTVAGVAYVGGLVGDNRKDVRDCYCIVDVMGASAVGGVVGVHFGAMHPTVSASYAAGPVSGTSSVGGLVGQDLGSGAVVTRSYWDVDTTGQTTSVGGGTGLHTAQMMMQATYVPFWDFLTVWTIDEGVDYPRHQVERALPASSFCDATDGALASCPCANPGSPNTGCDIQQLTGGVRLCLVGQATSPQNRATVVGEGFPTSSTPSAVVIRAADLDPASPVVFGDGLRCIGVPLARLAAGFAVGGVSTHTFGHNSMQGSGTFYYQLWFRNTPIMYCDPAAAFNLSNGRTLVW
jgi:hypothetical protein